MLMLLDETMKQQGFSGAAKLIHWESPLNSWSGEF